MPWQRGEGQEQGAGEGAAPPACGGRHELRSWVPAKPERAAPYTCGLQGAGVRGLILLEGGILHEIHKLVDERALGRDKLGSNMTLGNGLIKQKRDHFDVFIC